MSTLRETDERATNEALQEIVELPFDLPMPRLCTRCGLNEYEAGIGECVASEWRFGGMSEEIVYPAHVFTMRAD
jgi:hypothetical protein